MKMDCEGYGVPHVAGRVMRDGDTYEISSAPGGRLHVRQESVFGEVGASKVTITVVPEPKPEPAYVDGELYIGPFGTVWLRCGDEWILVKNSATTRAIGRWPLPPAPVGATVSDGFPARPLRRLVPES